MLTDLLTDISFYKEHIKSRVEGQKPPVAPLEARYQKKGEDDYVENNSRCRDFRTLSLRLINFTSEDIGRREKVLFS